MNTSNWFPSTPAFFEAKYTKEEDPWNFSNKPSELQRYDAIVSALAHRRYSRAFEPGCSIGVLTERLAVLCDTLESIDFSPTAVASAALRCAALAHVKVSCASFPGRFTFAGFDLLVLSEIGYYFSVDEWRALSRLMTDSMDEGSTLLAAHWLGGSRDHRISGDQVHDILTSMSGFKVEHSERHATFRLDRLVKQ